MLTRINSSHSAMFFLPFVREAFPSMFLVHIVRDGRDVALSRQQREPYQRAYVELLTNNSAEPLDEVSRVAHAWSIANLDVQRWARDELGDERFAVLRLEDLCTLAPSAAHTLAKLVGCSRDAAMLALESVIDQQVT